MENIGAMRMKERLTAIDGLRGIFSIIIVLFHCRYFYWLFGGSETSRFYFVFSHGYLGSEFFFVVSGFMIAYTYKEKLPFMDIASFLYRRISTIYPTVFVTTVLCVVLHIWELSIPANTIYYNPLTLKTIISSFMMLSSSTFVGESVPVNAPLWYMSALLVCYFLYYLFVCLNHNHGGKIYDFLCIFMIGVGGQL